MVNEINNLVMVNNVRKEIYEFRDNMTVGEILRLFSDCNYIQVSHCTGDSLIMICDWKEGKKI